MTVTYSAETGHRGPDKIAAGSGFAYAAGRCTLGHAVDLCRNIVHSIVYGIVRDDRTRRRRKFIYIFLRLIGGQKKKPGEKKKTEIKCRTGRGLRCRAAIVLGRRRCSGGVARILFTPTKGLNVVVSPEVISGFRSAPRAGIRKTSFKRARARFLYCSPRHKRAPVYREKNQKKKKIILIEGDERSEQLNTGVRSVGPRNKRVYPCTGGGGGGGERGGGGGAARKRKVYTHAGTLVDVNNGDGTAETDGQS